MPVPIIADAADTPFATGLIFCAVAIVILIADLWGLHGPRRDYSDHHDPNDWDGTE